LALAHGGQIFPFILFTKLAYPTKHGLSRIGKNAILYLSRGSGTWGPPIRILDPPEITVIKLQSTMHQVLKGQVRKQFVSLKASVNIPDTLLPF
jgi:hypothetical protein